MPSPKTSGWGPGTQLINAMLCAEPLCGFPDAAGPPTLVSSKLSSAVGLSLKNSSSARGCSRKRVWCTSCSCGTGQRLCVLAACRPAT